jgi:hypothetical protein
MLRAEGAGDQLWLSRVCDAVNPTGASGQEGGWGWGGVVGAWEPLQGACPWEGGGPSTLSASWHVYLRPLPCNHEPLMM